MTTVTVTDHDFSNNFSMFLEDVQKGKEIVISVSGKPMARLVPFASDENTIRFGVLRGKVRIAEDFDAPLPDEVLDAFEGRVCGS
ncbi:type II toxin-antitoxin system Phd/YefM family antitoxin [Desulfonatronum lacustre]|uniref:type II toxin-antitoxin system Phd/YefM family antitoxin n=1 Tax=Desulfonatronum lacustre TaxID=66849 RepID=UPI00048BCB5B|nr:type II toxin-antitoxin system prevent-host-death family antitoxin [Desulfonatronum lacustre]